MAVRLILLLCILAHPGLALDVPTAPLRPGSTDDRPANVEIRVSVNKVFDINEVEETYRLDGYLLMKWKDLGQAFSQNQNDEPRELINQNVDALKNSGIWWPHMEMINVVGKRSSPNYRLLIFPDGTMQYNERFLATCSGNFNVRKFPFDTQEFSVHLESFCCDTTQMRLLAGETVDTYGEAAPPGWKVVGHKTSIQDLRYDYLNEDYARYSLTLEFAREPLYYFCKILLPLVLIVILSWLCFWVKSLDLQISTGVALMLTLVAFNFMVGSMLPKVSYLTFLDFLILAGYINTFGAIVIPVFATKLNKWKTGTGDRLLMHCRYLFPFIFVLVAVGCQVVFLMQD